MALSPAIKGVGDVAVLLHQSGQRSGVDQAELTSPIQVGLLRGDGAPGARVPGDPQQGPVELLVELEERLGVIALGN